MDAAPLLHGEVAAARGLGTCLADSPDAEGLALPANAGYKLAMAMGRALGLAFHHVHRKAVRTV